MDRSMEVENDLNLTLKIKHHIHRVLKQKNKNNKTQIAIQEKVTQEDQKGIINLDSEEPKPQVLPTTKTTKIFSEGVHTRRYQCTWQGKWKDPCMEVYDQSMDIESNIRNLRGINTAKIQFEGNKLLYSIGGWKLDRRSIIRINPHWLRMYYERYL